MVTTIILSKDRPAQLQLLLDSIWRNGAGNFEPHVIANVEASRDAYSMIDKSIQEWEHPSVSFEHLIRQRFAHERHGFICFMCDDGILHREPIALKHCLEVMRDRLFGSKILCWSLRLGKNTTVCYPSGLTQHWPGDDLWRWVDQPQDPGMSDFGYPGSVDGHIFRTEDIHRMLDGRSFPNPTALECALVDGCRELAEERPLMACYPHSVYVGNPVNRVSAQSNVRHGTRYPVSADECMRRFLAGERIDLDRLDFTGVDGAHSEIELKWHHPA